MPESRHVRVEEDALDFALGDAEQEGSRGFIVPIEDDSGTTIQLTFLELEQRQAAASRGDDEMRDVPRAAQRLLEIADPRNGTTFASTVAHEHSVFRE